MKYLLDTHVLLWYIEGKSNLTEKSKAIIQDLGYIKYVSIASLGEIAIKVSNDQLFLNKPLETLPDYIAINDFLILPIQTNHLFQLKILPNHHKDPFDRLLIAQAITENLTIISADRHFTAYAVPVIWQ